MIKRRNYAVKPIGTTFSPPETSNLSIDHLHRHALPACGIAYSPEVDLYNEKKLIIEKILLPGVAGER